MPPPTSHRDRTRQGRLPFDDDAVVSQGEPHPTLVAPLTPMGGMPPVGPALPPDPPPADPPPRRVLRYVRNPRARRYIIRVRPDAVVRVTIPRGGSQRGAAEFVERHVPWIDAQLAKLTRASGAAAAPLRAGDVVPLRGVPTRVTVEPAARGRMKVRLGDAPACLAPAAGDVRPAVTAALRALAQRELPGRLLALAARHGLTVSRVTIRNQQTRWGSCATTGAISLNWRLVQMPPEVCDYVLVHELMHLREPNHSARFWRHVARACPWHLQARRWLRREGRSLL